MRVLTSTFFNMLSVVFIRFSCFSVTTFCLFVLSFISHLSSAHLSSFSSGLKIGHGGLYFTFCGRCMVVFVVKKEKKKNQTKGISHSRRRHSCDALSRVREPVYSHTHTHTAYIFVICKIRNRRSAKTHAQAKRVCLFFLFVTKE